MYGWDQLVVSTLGKCPLYRELMCREICYVWLGPASCVRHIDDSEIDPKYYRIQLICFLF